MSHVAYTALSDGGGRSCEITRRIASKFNEEEAMSTDWIYDKEVHQERFNAIGEIASNLPEPIEKIKEIYDKIEEYGTSFNNKKEIMEDLMDAMDKMTSLRYKLNQASYYSISQRITKYNDVLDEGKSTYWRNRLNEFKDSYNSGRRRTMDNYANWHFAQFDEWPSYYKMYQSAYRSGYKYDAGRSSVNACTCKNLDNFNSCETYKANKVANGSNHLNIDSRPEGT